MSSLALFLVTCHIIEMGCKWHYSAIVLAAIVIFVMIPNHRTLYLLPEDKYIALVEEPALAVPEVEELFFGRPYSKLLYVYADNKTNFAMFDAAEELIFPFTLVAGLALLTKYGFIQVNRSEIVRWDSVIGAKYASKKKNKIQIILAGLEDINIVLNVTQSAFYKDELKRFLVTVKAKR